MFKIRQFLKNKLSFILILLLFLSCIFYVFSNTTNKKLIPDVQEIIKLTVSHSYYYGYTDEHVARDKDFYPPAYFFISALFCKILPGGFNFPMAVAANAFYFLLTIIAIYFITFKICFQRSLALLAVVIFSFSPGIIYSIWHYLPEISVMAAVSLCFCFFVYSDYFKNRLACWMLGISIAFGMLCKFSFIFYVFLPLIFGVYKAIIYKDKQRIQNLMLVIVAVCLLSFWWYFFYFNFSKLIFGFHESLQMECTDIARGYQYFLIQNYQRVFSILKQMLSIPLLIVFISAAAVAIYKNNAKVLWLWVFPPLITFIFIPTNCVFRYLLPILPVVIIVIIQSIYTISGKNRMKIIIFTMIISLLSGILAIPFYKKNIHNSQGEEFLRYILDDAKRNNVSVPLLGLDAFHDPLHLVQDLYFTFWFLKLRSPHLFNIYYKDIEMLLASKKESIKFEDYYRNFLNCDYIVSCQRWEGWLKNYKFLAEVSPMIKDDIDRLSYKRKYFLFKKVKNL